MESKLVTGDIYLINLIKFKRKGKVSKIDIEKKMKAKDKFLLNQLSFLSNRTQYSKELERLSKENKIKFNSLKKNSLISMKNEINNINNINYNQRILKGASNRMILDILFNNQKIRKYILSKNKAKTTNLKSNNELKNKKNYFYPKFILKKCNIDNIQLISNKNDNINYNKNKLRHSLSVLLNNMNKMKIKNNGPLLRASSFKIKNNLYNYKPKKSKKNLKCEILNINNKYDKIFNNFYNSKKEKDEFKGMLTINYNFKNLKKINLQKKIY